MELTPRNERMLLAVLGEIKNSLKPLSLDDVTLLLPVLSRQEAKDALDELVRCHYLTRFKDTSDFATVYSLNEKPMPELPPGYRWGKSEDDWFIVSSRRSATFGVLILPKDYFSEEQ